MSINNKPKRRPTIFVTGPHSKTTIFPKDGEDVSDETRSMQNLQYAHNQLVMVNTANSIEILLQIINDQFEVLRHQIRESGARMRNFISKTVFYSRLENYLSRAYQRLLRNKKPCARNILEFEMEANVIMNNITNEGLWKPPRYTLNDLEEVLTTDDLEDGVIQRRSEKWECLPVRMKPEPMEDSFCEFQRMNVPLSMTYEDDDEDRLSMPSTRTAMTTEDQMAAIQSQLAMLSKQLMSLQKGSVVIASKSSRASSRRGMAAYKKSSIDMSTASSSSSEYSEDEGKGQSIYSPKSAQPTMFTPPDSTLSSLKSNADLPPVVVPNGIPPPPPPPPAFNIGLKMNKVETPKKKTEKPANSLPTAETITTTRPYLSEIAQGRHLLRKIAHSPGGTPKSPMKPREPVTSLEAALRQRFRGFHGENSFSEQEENDDELNEAWDE